jgi:hypothetical protein
LSLPATIDIEQTALARIVAGLFALLGQGNGIIPERIALSVHRAILLVLRPAESAVRRLVYLLSLGIRSKPAPARPMPSDIMRSGQATPRPCFALFDPRLRLVRSPKRIRANPRITFFGTDLVSSNDLTRANGNEDKDDDIAAAKILRRLEAIRHALDDLPRQARRLQRALQRRSKLPRLKMQGPMRPGNPPGHRGRRLHEIDDLLRRCHGLAREALPPDTS